MLLKALQKPSESSHDGERRNRKHLVEEAYVVIIGAPSKEGISTIRSRQKGSVNE
jgi:hypothetical protein